MKKLADNLKIYARKLGLSDSEVARRSRLSEVRYGHYARGRSEPDFATLLRICKVLNVTPNDLLLNTDEKTNASTKKTEVTVLRGQIAAGVEQLERAQLRMVNKVVEGLIEDANSTSKNRVKNPKKR